jgi:iron complex transport system substrate-binding protein
MNARLAACALFVLFGWAVARTGSLANVAGRLERPLQRPSSRQIEVLAETPEHRLVRHPLGETEVPLAPRRIVSLCASGTDGLVALGMRPVLATTSWRDEGTFPYLADHLRGVPLVRLGGGVNLETVLTARPNLILAGSAEARSYDQLSQIAPTVCMMSNISGNRAARILDVGDVVGKSQQARARLAEYRQRVSEARTMLSAVAAGQPVAFLRFRRNTCVIYTRTSMFGPLLFDDLGLTPDPAVPMVMSGGGWDVLSVERLSTLRAEHIFMVVDPDSETYLRRVAHTPIWREIPAVKHDHVHRVAAGTWLSGDGVLGCEAIIGNVLAAVVPERSSDATP